MKFNLFKNIHKYEEKINESIETSHAEMNHCTFS